jgi:hypothetical protein
MSAATAKSQERQPSPLESVPPPEVVRERIIRNAEEGRLLRSLYRLARRVAERRKEPGNA